MEQKLDEFDAEVKRLRPLVIDAGRVSHESRRSAVYSLLFQRRRQVSPGRRRPAQVGWRAAASTGLKRVIGPSRLLSELKLRISTPYSSFAPVTGALRRLREACGATYSTPRLSSLTQAGGD